MITRFAFFLLATAAAAPLAAQPADLDNRLTRIEKELRAVQRKVFPGGAPVQPEIVADSTPAAQPGVPATPPLADLTARVDAIETQIRTLTAQAEENGYRLRQLAEKVARIEAEAAARAAPAEQPAPADAAAAPAAPATPPAALAAVERPETGDAAEDAYVYGYRLWQAKLYPQAQAELKAFVEKNPKHRRASYAQNLLGRAYLDEGKPALASVAFYDNYQKYPKGERAPESLYWLGVALTQLKKPADACKVYAELEDVYAATLPESLKPRIAEGRKQAKCA